MWLGLCCIFPFLHELGLFFTHTQCTLSPCQQRSLKRSPFSLQMNHKLHMQLSASQVKEARAGGCI